MTAQPRTPISRRRLALAAVLGGVLAALCPLVPHQYQAACHVIATICTGGTP